MRVPDDIGLYDIQTQLPGLTYPSSRGLEALAHLGPDNVQAILEEVRSIPPSQDHTLRFISHSTLPSSCCSNRPSHVIPLIFPSTRRVPLLVCVALCS